MASGRLDDGGRREKSHPDVKSSLEGGGERGTLPRALERIE